MAFSCFVLFSSSLRPICRRLSRVSTSLPRTNQPCLLTVLAIALACSGPMLHYITDSTGEEPSIWVTDLKEKLISKQLKQRVESGPRGP